MPTIECDVAIIGAGTAGLAARSAAAGLGARTLLVEAGPGGTTCAATGCMPSKLLIAAASARQAVAEAHRFGIAVDGEVHADGRAVMARLRRERDAFVDVVNRDVAALPADTLLRGRARFVGPSTLQVGDGTRVRARTVVVATGSSPVVPEVLAPVADRVLTTETLFELDDLPESLAVVGAGPIGLELGQAFHRLGVRVAIVDKATRPAGLRDPAVAAVALQALGGELDLSLDAEIVGAEPFAEGVRLTFRARGLEHIREVARVVAASGRRPNLAGLDLEEAGIPLDRNGLPPFDRASLRCGDTAVFIAGDANHDRPVLHEARRQGLVAGENAARYPHGASPRRWPNLAITFSRPEIAAVGAPFDEEAVRHGRLVVGEADYGDQGRAVVEGVNRGLLRIYAEPGGVLVGAEMACPGAEHLAHLLVSAIHEGWTAARLRDRPIYHPTLEEGLRTALGRICEPDAGA